VGLPFIQSFLDSHFKLLDLEKQSIEKLPEPVEQPVEPEIKPLEDMSDKSKTILLIIASILLFISGLFFLYFLIRFIISFTKEFIKDLKDSFGKRRKVVKIEKTKETIKTIMLEAFHKIETGNNLRDSILNCYSALIYAANRFASIVKSPDSTAREFEYLLCILV
jgi:Txe/YoeB family toxin of Txe-Axe toxin-antitoxin module